MASRIGLLRQVKSGSSEFGMNVVITRQASSGRIGMLWVLVLFDCGGGGGGRRTGVDMTGPRIAERRRARLCECV